jgi:hypothetical protein
MKKLAIEFYGRNDQETLFSSKQRQYMLTLIHATLQCRYCKRWFVYESSLRKHLKVHEEGVGTRQIVLQPLFSTTGIKGRMRPFCVLCDEDVNDIWRGVDWPYLAVHYLHAHKS